MNDTAWNDYWAEREREYRVATHPWAKHAADAVKEHGDYADFVGFETWMNERFAANPHDLFFPVWDGMEMSERIGLYAMFCEMLPNTEASHA